MYLKHTFQIDKMFDKKIIRKEFDIAMSGHFRTLAMFTLKNYRCFVKQDAGENIKTNICGNSFSLLFSGMYPVWFIALSQIAKYGSFKVAFCQPVHRSIFS